MNAGRVAAGTALALVAFAGNSLLCRAALGAGRIDAAGFTMIRLASGAAVLALLVASRGGRGGAGGTWRGAAALLAYAAPFSFAYLRLPTGVGAFVLFASVQATMLGAAAARGRRLDGREMVGLTVALAGLATFAAPGAGATDAVGLGAMAGAGIAWGAYTLMARGTADPLRATAGNFLRATLLGAPLALAAVAVERAPDPEGWAAAAVSGAVTSGGGYAVWYAVVPALGAVRAALLQLLVPVLAATAGVLFLHEAVGLRLVAGGGAILAGVAVAIARQRARA